MPIYVMENGVKRELSAEEIAERERYFSSTPAPEPTPEERIAALEATTDDMILMMAELIGGD